jgi:dTDP-4-amino-4,6-dideoxygalactose transaminase
MNDPIPFIDLQAQRRRIAGEVEAAMQRVLEHGQFIMGPEVHDLERQLADYCGVAEAISCSSGTDALLLALYALEIGSGDAVFVPAFTFAASAEVVALAGATPIFVDVDGADFNLDPSSLEAAIEVTAKQGDLRSAAVIVVDLFGQPADHEAIAAIARQHGLKLIVDAAQSFGAVLRDKSTVRYGDVATTSFFPAKPLGCYGDGGAVFTENKALAETIRCLRIHGEGSDRYDNVRIGINGRMDTLQAAVLIEKLKIFDDEIAARNDIAARYERGLGDMAATPRVHQDRTSVWAQYTLKVEARDAVRRRLGEAGIPTGVYYPKPLNRQIAYQAFPTAPAGVPVSESLSQEVLSLPMHPYLDPATQDRIIAAVRDALAGT